MNNRYIRFADAINIVVGKAFAWLICLLMLVVSVEVFKRYVLNAPTAWIFDLDAMLYGTLFMMCGAYTLVQNGHVRGDFLYAGMKPRTQAALELSLYLLFFIPGILAHRGAFQRHGRRAAGLSVQVRDTRRRCARDAAGVRRDPALHRLHPDR